MSTRPPRERMVRSALELIGRQGPSGTGLREVVAHAGAPRGSLQHYFPGGKDQLVREAVALAGAAASRRVGRGPDGAAPPRPSAVLTAMVETWRRWLTGSDYATGCPVVATVADVAVTSDDVRAAAREAFDGWQRAITAALTDAGVPAARAPALATVCLSALEGAIVLSRGRRSTDPLDAVAAEIGPLLDAAAEEPR